MMLDEAKVVLEVKADGEVFWAHVAYTTFEIGAMPSLLRLQQARSGAAAPLVVGDGVKLECMSVQGTARWHCLMDFVELCGPSLCWTARLWIASCGIDGCAEDSEAEPWWGGAGDTARYKDAELPPSDDENEGVACAVSPGDLAECSSQTSDASDIASVNSVNSDEDPVEAAVAAMTANTMKRKKRGHMFEVRASRKAGRYALTFHLVFKQNSKGHKSFQITCDHHEPTKWWGRMESRTNCNAAKHVP
jgi:hypothetical protein